MTVLLAALAVAVPHTHQDCLTTSCVERVAAKRCDQHHVTSCIHRAALRWQVSYRMLRRKAWCESRFDPYARNPSSDATGLFQFLPSTWSTTPYAGRPITSAKYSSLAAGYMHHVGRAGEWQCA